eukprot:CAMPEP_0113712364 /NCGR_PEP_ID=MMETSP0038_2-20120614/31345_1 /TAXON_ID=2898 /ORGANISM="Cryptomonas paramecium" /LENGTH=65 /DNA_ID=CAMNT_0000638871 /DNA_START=866 /DNA_END=1063 /DNA_ORIENTATION=- /assembly_acc=CAM_ASM_000170
MKEFFEDHVRVSVVSATHRRSACCDAAMAWRRGQGLSTHSDLISWSRPGMSQNSSPLAGALVVWA